MINQAASPRARQKPALLLTILALLLALQLPARADVAAPLGPQQWLQRMRAAAQQLSYQGTFVYSQGGRFEVLRVLRRWQDGALSERVYTLNGPFREIVRQAAEVLCLIPEDGSLMLESQLVHGLFPTFSAEQWARAQSFYQLELGGEERVAQKQTQVLNIVPRYPDRYAYRLWLEYETGLLLAAALLDQQGLPVSQMHYVEVELDVTPVASSLMTSVAPEKYFVLATTQALPLLTGTIVQEEPPQWYRYNLPTGFQLQTHQQLVTPHGQGRRLEHNVYSDGLAQLSLYIEELAEATPNFVARSEQGSLNMRARQHDRYLVTAVGELPAAALEKIVTSVQLSLDGPVTAQSEEEPE